MPLTQLIDLLLVLTGGAIGLIGFFYLDAPQCWYAMVFGLGMTVLFLTLAVRGRRTGGASTSPRAVSTGTPPGARITEIVLLNEEGRPLAAWPLYGKASMVIGRDVGENQVNINLSPSTYASMIEVEHAVLNYTSGSWYVEDLASKNGVSVQKRMDGRKYKLAPDQPCRLDPGDIIFIGLTRLLLR